MEREEKLKALEAAMMQVEKQFGCGSNSNRFIKP